MDTINSHSLRGHYRRTALVLQQEHQELGRFGAAGVASNDMDVVRAFIKRLPGKQRHRLSSFHLHHDRALQHVDERIGIVPVDGSAPPGAYSPVIITTSLPGMLVRAFAMSGVTVGSWAANLPVKASRQTTEPARAIFRVRIVRFFFFFFKKKKKKKKIGHELHFPVPGVVPQNPVTRLPNQCPASEVCNQPPRPAAEYRAARRVQCVHDLRRHAHLRNLSGRPWYIAAIASWGVALLEYLFQVPANRIGYTVLSLGQLKIMQEVITLVVFVPFAMLYMRQPIRWIICGRDSASSGRCTLCFGGRSERREPSAVSC